jgi:hypothetical protein
LNGLEWIQYSLGNAFDLLNQVVGDLTQKQADWPPPGVANPIGATYWHAVSSADDIVHQWIQGIDPLRLRSGWQEKALARQAPEPAEDGDSQTYLRAIRVDLAGMHAYAGAVREAVQDWLPTLAPEDLERELDTPIGRLGVGKILETFVIWHIDAHCGEIAALKGCLGFRGYPF